MIRESGGGKLNTGGWPDICELLQQMTRSQYSDAHGNSYFSQNGNGQRERTREVKCEKWRNLCGDESALSAFGVDDGVNSET